MAQKKQTGCVEPAAGPLVDQPAQQGAAVATPQPLPLARVGHPAPDFELTAYHKGKFKNVRLSDYRGKWVILCFYPADFTFV